MRLSLLLLLADSVAARRTVGSYRGEDQLLDFINSLTAEANNTGHLLELINSLTAEANQSSFYEPNFASGEGGRVSLGVTAFAVAVILGLKALRNAYAEWWQAPENYSRYSKVLAESFRTTGSFDWVGSIAHGPVHISETIGDMNSGQGAVFESQATPALVMAMVAGFAIHSSVPGVAADLGCYFVNFLRASLYPIGYFFVMKTPYVTLVPKDIYFGRRTPSELEMRHIAAWKKIHALGFISGIILPILIELPLIVLDLVWYMQYEDESWLLPQRVAWLTLCGCRPISAVASVYSLVVFMTRYMADLQGKVQGRNFKCIATEYNTIAFGGFLALLANSQLLYGPWWGTPNWIQSVFLVIFFIFNFFQFCQRLFLENPYQCPTDGGMPTFAVTLMWGEKMDMNSMANKAIRKRVLCPLMEGISKLAGRNLYFLKAVQAGRPDPNDQHMGSQGKLRVPLGGLHPKICQLLIRPDLYGNVGAFDFHQLDHQDLSLFGADLAALIRALPSAHTLYFPYGSQYKLARKMPFLRLALGNYALDLKNAQPSIDRELNFEGPVSTVQGESERELQSPFGTDGVAFDVSEAMFAVEGLDRLRATPLADLLADAEWDCGALFQAFGTVMADINPLPPTDKIKIHAGIDEDSPVSYEVQVRGLFSTPPLIVLRLPRKHVSRLPDGWGELAEVSVISQA